MDEVKLKEIVKAAIVEVLEERRDLMQQTVPAGSNPAIGSTAKTILFWVALLLTAVLVYQVFQLSSAHPH
jgi:hypothetical protein